MPYFLDTNVVAYAFSTDPRSAVALRLLSDAVVSVQTCNELTNVARRKWGESWLRIAVMVEMVINAAASVRSVDLATHSMGRELAEKYRLGVYDGFIVAAALLGDCDTLYSEDMHHGLVIEDRLTIRNPFV